MWVYLFSLASVLINPPLACPLVFPPSWFLLPSDNIKVLTPLALCCFPLFFCRMFWMKFFAMQGYFQGRGTSKLHLGSYLDVLCKSLPIDSCVSTLLKLMTPACILQFDLHVNFQEAFRPKYECLKAPLVCRQILLPISSHRIGFISTKTIALIMYLGGWVLVVLIIISRFLLDSRPFLLVAIGASSLNSLPFQAHLKLSKELLPSVVAACLHSFEQFSRRGINQLKETISKKLHDHFFSSIISNMSFNSHRMCFKSCAKLGVGAWLFVCLVIPYFHMPSNVFSSTLWTKLGLPIL